MVDEDPPNYEEYDSASDSDEEEDSGIEEGELSSDEEAEGRCYYDEINLEWVDSERRSHAKVH